MTLRPGDELFDKRETAKYLHIKVPTVDKHLRTGLLVPTRVGGRVFFRKHNLDAFLRANERKARQEASERRRNFDDVNQ
jgi:excisionase family DNA binding protein